MEDKKPYSDSRWYDDPCAVVTGHVEISKKDRAESLKILVRVGVLTEDEYQEEVKKIYAEED